MSGMIRIADRCSRVKTTQPVRAEDLVHVTRPGDIRSPAADASLFRTRYSANIDRFRQSFQRHVATQGAVRPVP
jgi:hypothetical protein